MLILCDVESVKVFKKVGGKIEATVHSRYYIADAPHLMVIVVRGTTLAACRGRVVEATLGQCVGEPGWVRKGNDGKRHAELTILRRRLYDDAEKTLAQILRDAPMEHDANGP